MSYYDGFAPVYTLHTCVMREDRTLQDVAITARGSADGAEIKHAKRSIKRLLDECVSGIELPPVPEAVESPPDAATPEPEDPESAPAQENVDAEPEATKKSQFKPGLKGAVYMKCPVCGRKFHAFPRDYQQSIPCKCGHAVDLTDPTIVRYEYTCPDCKRHGFGHTNIEDAEYTETCVCGTPIKMAWNKSVRKYTSNDLLWRGTQNEEK